MNYARDHCPCCFSSRVRYLRNVDTYDYYTCRSCTAIFIDPGVLDEIDHGRNLREYDYEYWKMELSAAKERSYGPALARIAEVIYYARVPIQRFIDIGTGPGYVLDAIDHYLPAHSDRFYGVERFPPPPEFRTPHKNYLIGNMSDFPHYFEAGLCMEVIEHFTPLMLRNLLEQICNKSEPGACFIFNTGLPSYVLKEDPDYLDPVRRGHIMSWSVESVRALCSGLNLAVLPIVGKTWAFIVERPLDNANAKEDVRDRVWAALPENLELLTDPVMGSVLKILGHHTILAFR